MRGLTMIKLTKEQERYVVENCGPVDLEEMYNDMLDDYGPVEICGMEYEASYALREVDPVAYRCGMADYEDSERLVEIDDMYYTPDDVETALEELKELEEEEDGDEENEEAGD
jgi:hypothetical protein